MFPVSQSVFNTSALSVASADSLLDLCEGKVACVEVGGRKGTVSTPRFKGGGDGLPPAVTPAISKSRGAGHTPGCKARRERISLWLLSAVEAGDGSVGASSMAFVLLARARSP
jgi:hypothetical protein